MGEAKSYFFVGIGGSGMLPLAMIVHGRGHEVKGSDRSLDQGRLSAKFADLERQGIALFPQDGSGITSADQIVVASVAVEDSVPDMVRTREIGAARRTAFGKGEAQEDMSMRRVASGHRCSLDAKPLACCPIDKVVGETQRFAVAHAQFAELPVDGGWNLSGNEDLKPTLASYQQCYPARTGDSQ